MSVHTLTALSVFSFTSGIAIGYRFPYGSEVALIFLCIATAQFIFFFIARRRRVEARIILPTLLISIFIFSGIIRAQLAHDIVPLVCEQPCTISGEVIKEPEERDTYQRAIVSVGEGYANVELYVPLYPKLLVGSTVQATGIIKEPDPIFPHEDKRGFDYLSYLHGKGVGSQMMFPDVTLLDDANANFFSSIKKMKSAMTERINHHISYPSSTLANGILFGSHDMPKNVEASFRTAGISHIVVLSGFNIAIIISFTLILLSWFPLALRIALSFVSVGIFIVMVGGEASIIRASIMAAIALLATLVGREYVAKQALLISLFVIILYDPHALLYDVSLHLSFIATAGIVYGTPIISSFLQKLSFQKMLEDVIATTVAAYIATLPYVLYTFGSMSVYSLFANIIIVPLVPIAMGMSFLVTLVSYTSDSVARFIGGVTSMLLDGIISVSQAISNLPLSSLSLNFSFGGMVLAYVFIVTSCAYVSGKVRVTPLSETGVTHDETIYRY